MRRAAQTVLLAVAAVVFLAVSAFLMHGVETGRIGWPWLVGAIVAVVVGWFFAVRRMSR